MKYLARLLQPNKEDRKRVEACFTLHLMNKPYLLLNRSMRRFYNRQVRSL